MSNKILILSATGRIGSQLIPALQSKGLDFLAGASSAAGLSKLKSMNVTGITLDFNNPASLDRAMKGIDCLFMLTPATEQMVAWGKNIIQAAQHNKVQFIVRTSNMDTNPDSPHLLFRSHGQVDQMLRDSGIPHCIVQPNSFMQNFTTYWASSINNSNAFYSMHGDYRVSYIDMRDVVRFEAAILSDPMLHRNREYTITGPESLANNDIAMVLSNAAGRTIRYIPVDENQFITELRRMGISEWDINLSISIEHRIMQGSLGLISEEMRLVTGQLPTSFAEFARDNAQVWKKAGVRAR